MTTSELKRNIESTRKESHFFTRSTMKFFGDTMKNLGVRSATVKTAEWSSMEGATIECWELYRKQGRKSSWFWSKDTFLQIYPENN